MSLPRMRRYTNSQQPRSPIFAYACSSNSSTDHISLAKSKVASQTQARETRPKHRQVLRGGGWNQTRHSITSCKILGAPQNATAITAIHTSLLVLLISLGGDILSRGCVHTLDVTTSLVMCPGPVAGGPARWGSFDRDCSFLVSSPTWTIRNVGGA